MSRERPGTPSDLITHLSYIYIKNLNAHKKKGDKSLLIFII
jgi:hypothetical protein